MKPATASTHLNKICFSCCIFSLPKSHLSPKSQVFQSRGCILYKLLSPYFEDCGWALPLLGDSHCTFVLRVRARQDGAGRLQKEQMSPGEFPPSVSQFLQWVALNHVFHVLPQNNLETPVEGPKLNTSRWCLESVRGCPLLRCLGRELSTSSGNAHISELWKKLVGNEVLAVLGDCKTWDRDLVSSFGGLCLDCEGLLSGGLASIPNVSELK